VQRLIRDLNGKVCEQPLFAFRAPKIETLVFKMCVSCGNCAGCYLWGEKVINGVKKEKQVDAGDNLC